MRLPFLVVMISCPLSGRLFVIWSLQILRFIAALMVVYTHAAQNALTVTGSLGIVPPELAVMGRSGVDIFFVLSGVVIAMTAPGMTPAQFAWRRVRRILPIYFVACAWAIPLAVATGTAFGWRDALSTLMLWPATDVMTKPVLPVAWTLSFEMLFYCSTTLVLYDRRWLYVLGFLYGAAFLMRPLSPVFQFLGNPLVIEFLFGVAIAYAPSLPRAGLWLVPIGFAALAATGFLKIEPKGETLDFLVGYENAHRVFVYGLPSAMIVYGFMQIRGRENILTHLGDASYSLYLFHAFSLVPLLVLWQKFPIQPDLIVIIGIVTSVLLAWRINIRVEKPILRAIPTSINKRGFKQRSA